MSTAEQIDRLRVAALRQPGARERASGIKFQCPACAAEGHDVHQDNAILFPHDGKWGCAFASSDSSLGRKHWDAIGHVLGAFSNGHHEHGDAEEDAEPATTTVPTPTAPYTFTAALPPDHFVSRFITYGAECVDTAHEYLETAALVTLATATPGIRAGLRQYPRGLPTAFYALLIGDSTRSRKSTVAGLALDVVTDAVPDCRLAEQASPEAFIEQLAQRGEDSALLYGDEMGETFDKLHHAKYLAGLRGLMLELYEGRPYRYKRTSKRSKKDDLIADEMVIERPHLTVLGCTTPAIFEIVTARDVSSGFLARFAITMPAGRPPRRGLEEPTDDLVARRAGLVKTLGDLYLWARSAPRRVVFERGALAVVDRFAEAVETSDAIANERARAMLQRLNAMVVKLAMLVAAGQPGSTERADLVVTRADAEGAVRVAGRWRDYAIAFAERVGETALEQLIGRALRVMQDKKQAPRRVIAKLVHCSKRTMDDIESTLEDRGEIVVGQVDGKSGPSARVWTLVPR